MSKNLKDAMVAEKHAEGWGKVALEYARKGEVEMAYRAAEVAARAGREALGLREGTVSFAR